VFPARMSSLKVARKRQKNATHVLQKLPNLQIDRSKSFAVILVWNESPQEGFIIEPHVLSDKRTVIYKVLHFALNISKLIEHRCQIKFEHENHFVDLTECRCSI
jgi:hypothetical protein